MTNTPPVVELIFDRENFESYLDDQELTDQQWESIQSDLEGRVWNYFEEVVRNVVKDYEEGFYDEPTDNTPPTPISI